MTATNFPEVSIGFAMRMAWRRIRACTRCGDQFIPEVIPDQWCPGCNETVRKKLLRQAKLRNGGGAG